MLWKLLSAKHEGVGNLRHRRGMARIEVIREGLVLLTQVESGIRVGEVRFYTAAYNTFRSRLCLIDLGCSENANYKTRQLNAYTKRHAQERG